MIIMPVPKDIRNVKAKFIGPFTKRQTYAIVPAVVVGLLLNTFLGKLGLPSDLKVVITIAAVSPIIACGFIDVCDMPLAVFKRRGNREIFCSKMSSIRHGKHLRQAGKAEQDYLRIFRW